MSSTTQQTTTAQIAGIRRPSTFLTLVPVQSASYPKAPPKSPELPTAAIPAAIYDVAPISPPLSPTEAELKPVRRASSISSVGDKQRFLKLNPVFWGGIPGEDDFAIED
ncbi:hypothetical protein FN846DRAFT_774767 [Sphaerosporella brunnea]|uniref:Uncharacterized protein n=1 Tax=Sphaerosporella brunnea TaxID=1250544 RepID=A0A5J5F3G3_9PEZI|nr:hypothetical protein FN846DRAFT_774767 [Sphaerosporella brunnea]